LKETCDFKTFTAHSLGENILHIEFKKVARLEIEDIRQIFECHDKLGKGEKVYVLVSFNGFIPMNEKAMKEAKLLGKKNRQAAVAYVVKNAALRMGIKFFLNFYNPQYPIYISAIKDDALAWLQKEKDKNHIKDNA